MEPLSEALRPLHRQSELERALHPPGGIRVAEERELYQLREILGKYPGTVRAILETANRLNRPVPTRSSQVNAFDTSTRLWYAESAG